MRTSSPNMSLIYFLISSLPLLKSGFYDHVLCKQAHGLNKLLSLLVNLYQMSSRHLCQGSPKKLTSAIPVIAGKHPDKRNLNWIPQWRKGFGLSRNSRLHKEENEGENVQSAASSAPSPQDWQWWICSFSPGNNWESNLVLSHCTSKYTGLISSLNQEFSVAFHLLEHGCFYFLFTPILIRFYSSFLGLMFDKSILLFVIL